MKANASNFLVALIALLILALAVFFAFQLVPGVWRLQPLFQVFGLVAIGSIFFRFVSRRYMSIQARSWRKPIIFLTGVCLTLFSLLVLFGAPMVFPNIGSVGTAIVMVMFCTLIIGGVFLMMLAF